MKIFVSRPTLREEDLSLWHKLYGDRRSAFIDIETTGLNRALDCIYQVGLLFEDEKGPLMEQYLAENAGDERELLQAVGERLREFGLLIHFNGNFFDLPFLSERAQKLRLKSFPRLTFCDFGQPDVESADLYRDARPLLAVFNWENCRQKTLEAFLGIEREDPFTGGQLIEIFDEYSATGDARLEKVLLLHNYEDVVNMTALLRIKGLTEQFRRGRVRGNGALEEGRLTLRMEEPFLLSSGFTSGTVRGRFEAGSPELHLEFERFEDSLRYYLPDYRSYYYLPETAQIVHRSAADSVPASERRAAHRDECYLTRSGRFLCFPQEQAEALYGISAEEQHPLHFFRRNYKDKARYLEEEEFARFLKGQPRGALNEWIRTMI